MRKLFCILIFTSLLIGCQDQNSLQRIQELEAQLDECQNGAERIAARLKLDFKDGKDSSVFSLFQKIRAEHPDYPELNELEDLAILSSKRILELEAERSRKIEELNKERLASVNRLQKKTDDISGNSFYSTKRFTHYNNENLVSLYIGENSNVWLRFKASYTGDDWIFFEKIYLSYDGNTREIPFNSYQEKDSDNSGGNVWEWVDLNVDNQLIQYLEGFLESDKAKIRFQGKYTNTRTLSKNEKIAMKEVLLAYDVLKNG